MFSVSGEISWISFLDPEIGKLLFLLITNAYTVNARRRMQNIRHTATNLSIIIYPLFDIINHKFLVNVFKCPATNYPKF